MNALARIGRFFLAALETTGRLVLFTGNSVAHCVRPPFYPRLIGRQVADDNLHPSGKVHTPWADTIVPLVKSALLKEETP